MDKTNHNTQLLCAHSALLFAALLGLGIFGIAGWLPPVLPNTHAADIARMFVSDQTRIRIGISVLSAASVLWWAFAAAIATQMKRVEGHNHPLAYVQLGSAAGTVMAIMIPGYLWLALAYRPDLVSPHTLQMINDFCWLVFIGAYPPGLLQNVSIGICILSDKNAEKVYPRWVGYANLWVAVLFLPGALLPFFKTGPFAWNGVIGFWLVAFAFFGWILMMWWATVRAIKQQTRLESRS